MGMDVFGSKPASETGEYFRNNVWWWRPLADYLTARYPDLTQGCTYWQSNDGDGLDAAGSRALADALTADLDNGTVQRHVQEYQEYLDSLPLEECGLCSGTGLRTDEVGRSHGMDVPRDPQTGTGGCNGCQGTGKRASVETWYHLDIDNVRAFAQFLRDCGGFRIC